jgi:12-oxophytodienoic acid reductase
MAAAAADAAPLFAPLKVGALELKHRVVLAPLTRCRAINTVPIKESALYYAQRATPGGLLISEATCITQAGHGYPHTPGVYTKEQVRLVGCVSVVGCCFFRCLF